MNSKNMAGLSLAAMAIGFAVTLFLPGSMAVFLLKGAFEAGLVGGIADWFAVTALFRHPFGIPIPHTSLLLKNKDKIIRSLISAMENELLNKASIEDKLRKLNVLQLIASSLTKLLRKRNVRTEIIEFLIRLLRRIPLDQSLPHIQAVLASYIQGIAVKSAAETVVTNALRAGYDERAIDYAIAEAMSWLESPNTRTALGRLAAEKLSEAKVRGLTGFAIQAFAGFMDEDKLGRMLQNMLISSANQLLDRDNEYRQRIIQAIRVRLFELADDEERIESVKQWAIDRLQGEGGKWFIQARLEEMRAWALDKLEQQQSTGGRAVFTTYRRLVRFMNRQPEWITSVENRLLTYMIELVESNHYRIGQLVQENLERMDDASLVAMLEQKIGKDLQWIRVNGAICGFLIGLVLSLIQWYT